MRAQMQTSVTPTAPEEDCERVVNLKQQIFIIIVCRFSSASEKGFCGVLLHFC